MWIKSRKSSNNGSCVEVDLTSTPGTVRVRDTKHGEGSPVLSFTHAEWDAFQDGVRNSEFEVA